MMSEGHHVPEGDAKPRGFHPPSPDHVALQALLERVEKAEGADRELDFWVWVVVDDPIIGDDHEAFQRDIERHGITSMATPFTYTASLDAALALVERVLPGWGWHPLWEPMHGERGFSYGGLIPPDGSPTVNVALPGKRAPIALLAAMLKALIAQADARSEATPQTQNRDEP